MRHQIVCEASLLVVVCVLSLFFFPASSGSYSAVHGPVTALQAARSASQLRVAIVGARRSRSHRQFLSQPHFFLQ
jgi:hypothetical protein